MKAVRLLFFLIGLCLSAPIYAQTLTPLGDNIEALVDLPDGSFLLLRNNETVERSSDGGQSSSVIFDGEPGGFFLTALARNGNRVLIGGDDVIFWANVPPQPADPWTWTQVDLESGLFAEALDFAHDGNQTWLAAVDGEIWRSTNNGEAWGEIDNQPIGEIFTVLRTSTGWLAAGEGIFSSSDGLDWTEIHETDDWVFRLAVDGGGRVVAVGENGLILTSANGSAPFVAATGTWDQMFRAVIPRTGGGWWVGGEEGVLLEFNIELSTVEDRSLEAVGDINDLLELNGQLLLAGIEADELSIEPFTVSIAITAGQVVITQNESQSGVTYVVQRSSNLMDPSGWVDVVGSVTPGTGGPLVWNLSLPATPSFWRTRIAD